MSSTENTPEADYQIAKTAAICFDVPNATVFRVSGADAERYLHGRLTQDIKALTSGTGAKSLLLSPQGKILGHMLVLRCEADFFIVSDPLPEDAHRGFVENLLQFKVADLVDVEDLSETYSILALLGPRAQTLLEAEAGKVSAPWQHAELEFAGAKVHAIHAQRGAPYGVDFLVEKERVEELTALLVEKTGVPLGATAALELLRIEAGIPRYGVDIDEKIIAPEIPLDELVSFNKGCYAGQEVVEMAIARGRPNRRLTRFRASTTKAFAAGTPITKEGEEKALGAIRSSCVLTERGEVLALGFVKSSVSIDDTLHANGVELSQHPIS